MKIFISHKLEDRQTALLIAKELDSLKVAYYLDSIDSTILKSGKNLTDHIKNSLNDCTDIVVIMSESTKYSQWVPFEVGMSAQNDMPTATYLKEDIILPEFLEYWPRLKNINDIRTYVKANNEVQKQYLLKRLHGEYFTKRMQTNEFYDLLKRSL